MLPSGEIVRPGTQFPVQPGERLPTGEERFTDLDDDTVIGVHHIERLKALLAAQAAATGCPCGNGSTVPKEHEFVDLCKKVLDKYTQHPLSSSQVQR